MADLTLEQGSPQPEKPVVEETPIQSHYKELADKKGYKTPDDMAKSYGEMESMSSKTKNAFDTTKSQVESNSQGLYTVDDKGTIVLTDLGQQQQTTAGSQQYQQPYQQPQQPTQQYDPNTQPVYDPYTNQPITDPAALQLAKMPLGMHEAMVFNALAQQREGQQRTAFEIETEMMSDPTAKGFEQDLKKVIMQVPLAQRANKQVWKDALLRVKGAKYDQDKSNFGGQAVDDYLNKKETQQIQPAAGVSSGGSSLPPEMEQQYRWYETHQPNMFKDRADYMRHTKPSGGR